MRQHQTCHRLLTSPQGWDERGAGESIYDGRAGESIYDGWAGGLISLWLIVLEE